MLRLMAEILHDLIYLNYGIHGTILFFWSCRVLSINRVSVLLLLLWALGAFIASASQGLGFRVWGLGFRVCCAYLEGAYVFLLCGVSWGLRGIAWGVVWGLQASEHSAFDLRSQA